MLPCNLKADDTGVENQSDEHNSFRSRIRPITKALRIKLTLVLTLAAAATPAYAYLDPGTGSLLLQGAIATIAAVAFTVKTYWYRIRAFMKGEKWEPPVLDDDLTDSKDSAE